MARRRGRSATRKRVQKDWVYNEYSYANSGNNLVGGPATAIVFPLTWSQNTRRLAVFGSVGAAPVAGAYESWAGIPEGANQRVFAVDGYVRFDPATWAVGSELTVGMRLVHMDQNPQTGQIQFPSGYSLWVNAAGESIAQMANRGFLKEWRWSESALGTAISNRGEWTKRIFWSSPKGITLSNGRALWLWVESINGSVATRTSCFVRALMQQDG